MKNKTLQLMYSNKEIVKDQYNIIISKATSDGRVYGLNYLYNCKKLKNLMENTSNMLNLYIYKIILYNCKIKRCHVMDVIDSYDSPARKRKTKQTSRMRDQNQRYR